MKAVGHSRQKSVKPEKSRKFQNKFHTKNNRLKVSLCFTPLVPYSLLFLVIGFTLIYDQTIEGLRDF